MSSSSEPAPASVQSMVTVMIPTAITAVVFITLFILLRKSYKRVYEPRSTVETVPEDLKAPLPPTGAFSWLSNLLHRPESFLVRTCGADGYFFLRFLFEFGCIAIVGVIVTWPILFPINATNSNHESGLETLSYSNVRNKWRFLAHIFVSWLYFGLVIFLIYRELVYYTTFRHVLQTTPLYDSLLSTRTMLMTEIPPDAMDEQTLRENFPAATNIWYARDYKKLQELTAERTKLAGKYEGAVNGVINKAVKMRAKAIKKNKPTPEPKDDINKYLKDGKKRPTHRLKFLIGKKVDTLDYGKTRLGELNEEIEKKQGELDTFEKLRAVFISFPTQMELQKAYQAIPYNKLYKRTKRVQAVAPDDIIWSNLSLTTNTRRVKKVIANTILTLLVIFWCIPVAVVGAISNINSLMDIVPFLRFLNNLPSFLMGLVTGLLPVIALAILMSLVPPFIKWMGRVAGCLTVQQVNKYCQSWFYAFLVVNSFIMLTIASSATSVVPSIIHNPESALQMLAQRLPPASNFYISYMLLQALTIGPGVLLQIVALALSFVLGRILDSTPRAKWNRWNNLKQPDFSTLYPNFQLICVIGLAYAIIAPLILGFVTIAFLFFYGAYIYTLVHVQEPNKHDARGRNYVSALFQLFVALYLAEVILIAMFVFGKNWVSVALESVALAATAISHIYLKWKFLPIVETVPVSAIRYSSGDPTAAYPMYDQGWKEIKTEGQNYWEGGNQLGLDAVQNDQVSATQIQQPDSATAVTDPVYKESTNEDGRGSSPFHPESESKEVYGDEKGNPIKNSGKRVLGAPSKGVSWFTRFLKPKLQTFDDLRAIMPDNYFNYIEYNPDFISSAYDDPAINDPKPHIWIARDELGLSEIEKNKAAEEGVQVSDDNTGYNEKNQSMYTGAPPSYEEAIRV